MAASFIVPALSFSWLGQEVISPHLSVNIGSIVPQTDAVQISSFDWWQILSFIYLKGVSVSAARLVYQLIIIKNNIDNPEKGAAFSFFRFKAIDHSLADYQIINRHEEAHIRQMHSADILLFEVAGVIAWFNPVIYLYKSSIRNVHEFLADQEAAGYMGNKKEYAFLLLGKALNINQYPLVNSFFKESLIKKRVLMLQKERSGRTSILRYCIIFPMLAAMIVLSSAAGLSNEKSRTPNVPDQQSEFPGGFQKFAEYLVRSLKYPPLAIENRLEGRVQVSFIVNVDGPLTDVKLVKGLGGGLDEEALRMISQSPDWSPGILNGKPVRTQYQIPINFRLPAKK
jgi:TonB family protein